MLQHLLFAFQFAREIPTYGCMCMQRVYLCSPHVNVHADVRSPPANRVMRQMLMLIPRSLFIFHSTRPSQTCWTHAQHRIICLAFFLACHSALRAERARYRDVARPRRAPRPGPRRWWCIATHSQRHHGEAQAKTTWMMA
jgi:hypothetical protein